MTNSNFAVSKIVATPTENSWAQAYNAGSLFAVLSLTKKSEEDLNLNLTGKSILNTLEEEYYTLEEKNLETIKKAHSNTCQKIPENIHFSFLVAAIVENVLYIFTKSKAKVILKRNEEIGSILDSFEDSDKEDITAVSGALEDNDLIILSTEDFFKVIKEKDLTSALLENAPSDIAENLTPKVHKQEEGGAASIFILYKKPVEPILNNHYLKEEDKPEISEREDDSEEDLSKEAQIETLSSDSRFKKIKGLLSFPTKIRLGHSKKVLLTISVVLISVLIISALFAIKKQEEAKTRQIFQEVFNKAQSKFNEGNALLSLNKNLAREDLSETQKVLQENKSKFKQGSKELAEITALLEKTEKLLNETAQVNSVSAKEVDFGKSPLLSGESKNSDSFAFSQDEKNIYFAKNGEIYSLEKSSDKKKSVIKDDALKNVLATSPYNGNIYILDKNSKILKFAAGDSGFGKSNYLKENPSIDWSKVNSMTIDGSVWILLDDGTIYKFTKGAKDSFQVSGLDSPLVKPIKIFTDKDIDNVYVLDNGNSRIVVLNKDGAYQSQYSADVIANAKDFEVLEKDKKIYLLSQDKIYQLDLK